MTHDLRSKTHWNQRRDGVSAVELALILPVMMIFLLGGIDAGQAVDVWNKVDNASREGARFAARSSTSSATDVKTAITGYLDKSFSNASASQLATGLTITIRDDGGNVVTDLTSIPAGNAVNVEVSLNFDTVRWSKNISMLSTEDISTTTRMRRE